MGTSLLGALDLEKTLEIDICKRWAYIAIKNKKGIDYNVPVNIKVKEGN